MTDDPRPAGELRTGQDERERVVAALRHHAGAGRLDVEEAGYRIAAAAEARTAADLSALLGDLPPVPGQDPARRRGWRLHAVVCAVFSAGLGGVWLVTRDPTPGPTDLGPGYWWPAWVALLWAMAVVLHFLYATGRLALPPSWGRRPAEAAGEPASGVPELGGPSSGGPAAGGRVQSGGGIAPDTTPSTAAVGARVLDLLTAREREVLALVGTAYTNREIARRLGVSERTARTHVSNILRKLGLSSRTEAALLAVRAGLSAGT